MGKFKQIHTINCRGRILSWSRPIVMGIVNVNKDSFYPGSRFELNAELATHIEHMIKDGARILDVGVMSSRPGASELTMQVEAERLSRAIRWIKDRYPDAYISADCYRAPVAQEAIDAGADIINDIGGGLFDSEILSLVARANVPYVLMHNRAKSHHMHEFTEYDDVVTDVKRELAVRLQDAMDHGIVDVIIDPGIGFSKTAEQNFTLIRRLDEFEHLDWILLVGLSRKSFIYKTLDIDVNDSLNGTTAMHMMALERGAAILRVHDVKEAVQCIDLYHHAITK